MPENDPNATQESLPETDVNAESSTVQDVNKEESSSSTPGEATPQEAGQEQVPFNKHPDWIAFQKRKEQETQYERARADRLEQQLLKLSNRLSQPKTSEKDPYEGLDDETKRFYQQLDQRYEQRFQKMLDDRLAEKEKVYKREIMSIHANEASKALNSFMSSHPDVTEDTPEYSKFVGSIKAFRQAGHDYEESLNLAYRASYFDSLVNRREKEVLARRKAEQTKKTQEKIAANLESGTVSPNSPVQPKEKKSVREFVNDFLQQRDGNLSVSG
jgi:hypothetical protein